MCTQEQGPTWVALFVFLLTLSRPASAQQNLTWDANGAAAGTGGTGTWDTNVINLTWFNGMTFQSWNNAHF